MAQDRLERRRGGHLGSHRTLPELQYCESATTPGVSAAVQLVGSCVRVIELADRAWNYQSLICRLARKNHAKNDATSSLRARKLSLGKPSQHRANDRPCANLLSCFAGAAKIGP